MRSLVVATLAAVVLAGCHRGPTAAMLPGPDGPTATPDAARTGPVGPPPALAGLRLPDTVRPRRYAVELELDPARDSFAGKVDIDLEITGSTSALWLNATQLELDHAVLTVGGRPLTTYQIASDRTDVIGLGLARPLAGAATLSIRYRGRVDAFDEGVFRRVIDGAPYLFTQFEAVMARRAVPCFDEPGVKAPWQLTLRIPAGLVALANTSAVREETRDGVTTVVFGETDPLPAYLVAFAVGPFELVDGGPVGKAGVPLRIVTPRGWADRAAAARALTPGLVAAAEAWLGTPYPFDKLDLVAVPTFFGGMENAGLITFAADDLLARPAEDSPGFRRRVTGLVAHELAHQWFGDLATMAWWDELWLNEGFANYLGSELDGSQRADSPAFTRLADERDTALVADEADTAHRLRQPIDRLEDIEAAFDAIAYAKGHALLLMLERWLGEPAMRAGSRRYLERFRFASATSVDLAAALAEASQPAAAEVIDSFVNRDGAPALAVSWSCHAGRGQLTLVQDRARPLGAAATASPPWLIPACVRVEGDRRPRCQVLREASTVIALPRCPRWVDGNVDGAGYYRTRYGEGPLAALIAGGGLSRRARAALIDDVVAALGAGALAPAPAVTALLALLGDRDLAIVERASRALDGLAPLVDDAGRTAIARILGARIATRARAIGLVPRRGESLAAELTRPALVRLAALAGDARLVAEARALVAQLLDDASAAAPEIAELALRIAAATGDAALFDRMVGALRAADSPARRRQLVIGLASFADPALAERALGLALDSLDHEEIYRLIELAAGHPGRAPAVFDWLDRTWERVATRVPLGGQAKLTRVIGALCDPALRPRAAAWAARLAGRPGGAAALADHLAHFDRCVARRATLGPALAEALARPASSR